MEIIDIKGILKTTSSLKLVDAQKRLILKALIKTNFRVKDAYELNCADSYINFNCYAKLVQKTFTIGVKKLKEVYSQYLKETKDGKI